MQTHHLGHVDSVEIDDDEGRFQLVVTTNDGDRYQFDIHGVALELVASSGFRGLTEWAAQGLAIKAQVERGHGITSSCAGTGHELCTWDRCECDCHTLAPDDPKHPTYGERLRVAADIGGPARAFRFLEGQR